MLASPADVAGMVRHSRQRRLCSSQAAVPVAKHLQMPNELRGWLAAQSDEDPGLIQGPPQAPLRVPYADGEAGCIGP
jgi:hypothetical protein